MREPEYPIKPEYPEKHRLAKSTCTLLHIDINRVHLETGGNPTHKLNIDYKGKNVNGLPTTML